MNYKLNTLNLYHTYPDTAYSTEHTVPQSQYRVLLFHLSYHILAQDIPGIVHYSGCIYSPGIVAVYTVLPL